MCNCAAGSRTEKVVAGQQGRDWLARRLALCSCVISKLFHVPSAGPARLLRPIKSSLLVLPLHCRMGGARTFELRTSVTGRPSLVAVPSHRLCSWSICITTRKAVMAQISSGADTGNQEHNAADDWLRTTALLSPSGTGRAQVASPLTVPFCSVDRIPSTALSVEVRS